MRPIKKRILHLKTLTTSGTKRRGAYNRKLKEISKQFVTFYGKPVGYHPVNFDLLWSGDDYWETKSTRLNIGVRAFPSATGYVKIELDDEVYYEHKIDYLINNQ